MTAGVRYGLVGCGGYGKYLAALCDVDDPESVSVGPL